MADPDRIQINEARIRAEFDELARIDSESFGEREMADRLKEKLAELGIQAKEDDTAEKIGGNAGNLFGTLKGGMSGTPILLSGHMDTVAPGIGKKPVFHEDGTITSDGTTVLGADDLTGVIAILEGIRAVQEAGIPHRDIEILFAAAEEPFTRGSSEFDFSQMKAKESYVLDVTGPVGTAILQAPTILSFEAAVKGRAAHAGFEPEKGIHAIQTAARAIAALKLGHVDEETTLNVGLISGGSVVNAVPELCTCRGEIRSYSHEKAMETLEDVRAVFETAVKEAGQSFLSHTASMSKPSIWNRTRRWQFILPGPAAPGNRAEIRQHLRRQRRKHDDAARNPMRGAFLRYVRCSFRAGVCEGGGYCEWGEIDRGTDYAGARSEYRVKLKNVDIAERLYYFTKTII